MRWKPLFISFALILFLWATFLWIRPVWEVIDTQVFKTLNSNLLSTKFLQYFWALLNHKQMDLVEDAIFLLFLIAGIKAAPKSERWRKAAQLLFCIFLAASVIFFINRNLLRSYPLLPRESPSLVVKPCIRISQTVPWKYVKDETIASFPGDHATTLLLFGLLYSAFVPRRLALYAWLYLAFRMLPRLVLGAHWLSDIAVGSVSLALFFVSCFLYTPLGTLTIDTLEKMILFGRRKITNGIQEKPL